MSRRSRPSAPSAHASRNQSCPCGSGRKYKYCCERKAGRMSTGGRIVLALVIVTALVGVVLAFANRNEQTGRPGQVWSPEHGHYHDVQ